MFVQCGFVAAQAEEPSVDQLLAWRSKIATHLVPALIAGSVNCANCHGPGGSLADRLAPLSQRIFFGPEMPADGARVAIGIHTVQAGEYPSHILKRYGLSNEWLQLLNPDYSDTRLRAGQKLKVFDASQLNLKLLVQRQFFRCWLIAKPEKGQALLLANFPVGIGKADRATPLGSTTFRHAVLDPEWTHPDTGEVYGPHHPDNVLGGYWLGLKPGVAVSFMALDFMVIPARQRPIG